MNNKNKTSSISDTEDEPDISNVLQNTFTPRVPDENDGGNQEEPVTSFNNLTENNIGKKVSICGLVTHSSSIKLCTLEVSFKCIECQETQTLRYNNGGRYHFPFKCKSPGCKSKEFASIMECDKKDEYATFFYLNKFRMQDVWNGSEKEYTEDNFPKIIDCEIRNNLVDKVKPGDFVAVKGKLQVHEISETNKNNKGSSMHHLYIDIVDIMKVPITNSFIESERDDSTENMFSLRDLYTIKQVTITSDDLFKRVVNSFCPSVYGHELIKAGILLSIFGKDDNGAIHVLIVGDPGTDKIELLLAADSISPNTVFTQINRGDKSSILPTLQYDRYFNEWILEAGSLALSDKGICRIDDFEKIGKFNALAEAISRKSYPVSKYGVKCSLKTQTTIIASANPVDGHYNKDKTLSENLKINNALLSNFDLVFLLLDIPDEEMDNYLSERVMTVHSGLYPGDRSQRYVPTINRNHMTDIPLSERLKRVLDENTEILSIEFLQKYIAYAHKYVHPRLSEEARKMIKLFYINMGHKYLSMDETTITIRQLETMIRLAQARARMELRDLVTCSDVEDIAEIIEFCLFRIQRDELGNSRPRKGQSGGGRSGKQKEAKRFLEELQRQRNAKGSDIFTMQEMQQMATDSKIQFDNFQGFIDYLNEQSLLLKKGPGTFQLRA